MFGICLYHLGYRGIGPSDDLDRLVTGALNQSAEHNCTRCRRSAAPGVSLRAAYLERQCYRCAG